MKLFPKDAFYFDGPQDFVESDYSYLSRSLRPEIQRMRDLLQVFFDNYPSEEKPEILSRLRSGDGSHFDSAIHELCLYNILIRHGCSLEVHPLIESANNHKPDFLVTTKSGEQFYLEARVASQKSPEEAATEELYNRMIHFIANMDSPDFFINVNVIKMPSQPIPRAKILEIINILRNNITPEDLENQYLDSHQWKNIKSEILIHGSGSIEFSLLPKNKTALKPDSRSIGIMMKPLRVNDSPETILKAIKKKAGRFKNLQLPYVVALDAKMWGILPEDINHILYSGGGLFTGHNPLDKIWNGESKPPYTRVTSVWFTLRMSLTSLPQTKVIQYLNPWASKPLKETFPEFGSFSLMRQGSIEHTSGKTLAEIFGLPPNWPE